MLINGMPPDKYNDTQTCKFHQNCTIKTKKLLQLFSILLNWLFSELAVCLQNKSLG